VTFICVAAMDLIALVLAGSYASLALGRPIPAWLAAVACASAPVARGASLKWKAPEHRRCVALFDRGIGLFLAALFFSAFASIPNPIAARLAPPYLALGILALLLSRRAGLAGGGRGGRGAAAAVIVALGATAASLAAPGLSSAAAAAGRFGARALKAIEPALVAVFKLMAGYGMEKSEAGGYDSLGASAARATVPPAPDAPWLASAMRVLIWASIAAVAAFLAAAALSAALKGLAALLERLARGGRDSRLLRGLLAAARAAALFLDRCRSIIAGRARRRSAARRAYSKLLACGRAAALAREPSETPREYASRLERELPRSAGAAIEIVLGVELEAYGGLAPDEAAARRLSSLRRRASRAAFVAERVGRKLGRARFGRRGAAAQSSIDIP
jgi:hypothetical protein